MGEIRTALLRSAAVLTIQAGLEKVAQELRLAYSRRDLDAINMGLLRQLSTQLSSWMRENELDRNWVLDSGFDPAGYTWKGALKVLKDSDGADEIVSEKLFLSTHKGKSWAEYMAGRIRENAEFFLSNPEDAWQRANNLWFGNGKRAALDKIRKQRRDVSIDELAQGEDSAATSERVQRQISDAMKSRQVSTVDVFLSLPEIQEAMSNIFERLYEKSFGRNRSQTMRRRLAPMMLDFTFNPSSKFKTVTEVVRAVMEMENKERSVSDRKSWERLHDLAAKARENGQETQAANLEKGASRYEKTMVYDLSKIDTTGPTRDWNFDTKRQNSLKVTVSQMRKKLKAEVDSLMKEFQRNPEKLAPGLHRLREIAELMSEFN